MESRRKMFGRVGVIVHNYYLLDTRVRRQAECLADMGLEVHVVCGRRESPVKGFCEPPFEIVNGVHIHRVPLSKKRGNKLRYIFEYVAMTIFALWKLTLLHMKKKFDVVHIHNMPDLLVVAGLISKVTGATLVLDIHDPMSELFQQKNRVNGLHPMIRALKFQERLCYRLADHLVTVTHNMAENVAEKRGCQVESVKVVHNFPDLISFPIREEKKKWPMNGDGIVFLFSGTVTGQYRLDITVRAIAIASQSIPNIRFQILGGGDSLEEVLALAEDLGIGDRVEHIPPVHVDMVKNVMANVDVGISTHQSGVFGDLQFPTKIVEFMTQGLPVISSRTYTIEQYIPEDSIFYFEPGEIGDLVNQIILMYNEPGLVLQKINNSKKLLSKYTWQEEKRSFTSFYGELFKMH